jgi:hypothetical protein
MTTRCNRHPVCIKLGMAWLNLYGLFANERAAVIVTPNSMVRMIVSATTDGGQAVTSGKGHLGGVGEAACRNLNRTHRGHQRPPGSTAPQRPRLPQPHPLPLALTAAQRRTTRTRQRTLNYEEPATPIEGSTERHLTKLKVKPRAGEEVETPGVRRRAGWCAGSGAVGRGIC